jgi:hypothetical protein
MAASHGVVVFRFAFCHPSEEDSLEARKPIQVVEVKDFEFMNRTKVMDYTG